MRLIHCFCFNEGERVKIHFREAEEDDGRFIPELGLPSFCPGSNTVLHLGMEADGPEGC